MKRKALDADDDETNNKRLKIVDEAKNNALTLDQVEHRRQNWYTNSNRWITASSQEYLNPPRKFGAWAILDVYGQLQEDGNTAITRALTDNQLKHRQVLLPLWGKEDVTHIAWCMPFEFHFGRKYIQLVIEQLGILPSCLYSIITDYVASSPVLVFLHFSGDGNVDRAQVAICLDATDMDEKQQLFLECNPHGNLTRIERFSWGQ